MLESVDFLYALSFKHIMELKKSMSVRRYAISDLMVAVIETSLVTYKTPTMVEVYGTEGTLVVCDNDIRLISGKMEERFKGWVTPGKLPEALPHPLRQWVDGILYNKPIIFGTEAGTKLTELLEAAYTAHRGKREVPFP